VFRYKFFCTFLSIEDLNMLGCQQRLILLVEKHQQVLKGDTDASILDGVKIVRFKFPALFLSIESENVWPSAMDTFC
jgi:hypothetical protein